jgi:hypothetical protein
MAGLNCDGHGGTGSYPAQSSDPEARYWGGRVEERSLVLLGEARLSRIGLVAYSRSQAVL